MLLLKSVWVVSISFSLFLFLNLCFHFHWVSTEEWDCWVTGQMFPKHYLLWWPFFMSIFSHSQRMLCYHCTFNLCSPVIILNVFPWLVGHPGSFVRFVLPLLSVDWLTAHVWFLHLCIAFRASLCSQEYCCCSAVGDDVDSGDDLGEMGSVRSWVSCMLIAPRLWPSSMVLFSWVMSVVFFSLMNSCL